MSKKLVLLVTLMMMVFLAGVSNAQPGTDDNDGDGIPNTADLCPNEFGLAVNRGCPAVTPEPTPAPVETQGTGGNNPPVVVTETPPTEEPTPAPTLAPMPLDGECVASPLGLFAVNVRQFPNEEAPILTTLGINELAPVLGVTVPVLYAEPEWVSENPVWYLVSHNGVEGWVSAKFVRLGGDCSDFVVPNLFGGDDIQAPLILPLVPAYLKIDGIDGESENAGGVFIAAGDLNGDGVNENAGGHKDWILIESFVADGQGLLAAYRPAEQRAGVVIDPINGVVRVDDADGLPLVDIVVGGGAGTQPSAPIPNELDVLVCANIANPDAPLTEEDCVVITSAKAEILVEALDAVSLVCVDVLGDIVCRPMVVSSADTGECVPVAGTLFCATDYVPAEGDACSVNDGVWSCEFDWQVNIAPLSPTSPLPGLSLLNPPTAPVTIGLLLPAVQKVREAAR
ncbi:MAG: SH3 domain-containing protein [Anaerolineae bacterium]|jgi:hypothetical protein|nr:SH3 domain-containing protein [Anaerolineae bacterium]